MKNIFIFDDDSIDTKAVVRVINAVADEYNINDIVIQSFLSSKKGIKALGSEDSLTLLILDVHIPDFDGIEVVTWLADSDINIPIA